jgi:hypothetical protein
MSSNDSTLTVLQRDDDLEGTVNREFLRGLVQKQMFCPETGSVLDVRSAVAFEVTHTESGRCALLHVTTADAYDEVFAERAASCAELDGFTVTVYDGRILFGRKR